METTITPEYLARLAALPDYLNSQLFGQAAAVAEFSGTFRRAALSIAVEPGRPRSFMLLLGPTGTGKTEITILTSQHIWGTKAIARLNMAEFSDENGVLRVIGKGREYPDDEGQLGAELANLEKTGGRIVLLDEIEKAHPRVAKLFLGMEAAEVTFGNGRKADLSKYFFVITSNLGTAKATQMALDGLSRNECTEQLIAECARFFNKEVVGRFTKIIMFDALHRDVLARVAGKFIDRVVAMIRAHPCFPDASIEITPEARLAILAAGKDVSMGARPMRHSAENRIGEALADYLIAQGGACAPGAEIVVCLASSLGREDGDGCDGETAASRGFAVVSKAEWADLQRRPLAAA